MLYSRVLMIPNRVEIYSSSSSTNVMVRPAPSRTFRLIASMAPPSERLLTETESAGKVGGASRAASCSVDACRPGIS